MAGSAGACAGTGPGGVAGEPAQAGAAGHAGQGKTAGDSAVAGAGGEDPGVLVDAWEPCLPGSAVTAVATVGMSVCWVGCSNGDIYFGGREGTSWSKRDDPSQPGTLIRPPDGPVSSITPRHDDVLRAYFTFVSLPSVHKVWETPTQGRTWSEHSDSSVFDVWSFSYNPLDTQRLQSYAVATDGSNAYLDCSTDAGQTYNRMFIRDELLTLPSASSDLVSAITMIDGSMDNLIVGTVNGNLYVTANATTERTWGRIGSSGMPTGVVTKIAVRQTETREFWATFQGTPAESLWISKYGTLQWENGYAPGLPEVEQNPAVSGWYGVSFNPLFPDTLYLFGTEGAFRTDNGGESWVRTWPE